MAMQNRKRPTDGRPDFGANDLLFEIKSAADDALKLVGLVQPDSWGDIQSVLWRHVSLIGLLTSMGAKSADGRGVIGGGPLSWFEVGFLPEVGDTLRDDAQPVAGVDPKAGPLFEKIEWEAYQLTNMMGAVEAERFPLVMNGVTQSLGVIGWLADQGSRQFGGECLRPGLPEWLELAAVAGPSAGAAA